MTRSAVALSTVAMLSTWETGAARAPVDRALALLRRAVATGQAEDLDGWSIGRRDARLLDLRCATFGDCVTATTVCPSCGQELEVAVSITDIRSPHGDAHAEFELTDPAGLRVRFRLPTSADLRVAAIAGSWDLARRMLAQRCVIKADRHGQPVSPAGLPEEVVSEIGQAMAANDPQSDVRFDVACDLCGHGWQVRFDIADYLWREVAAQARHLVAEVHTLAMVYGWSEADILALSEQRRQRYLELVTG